MAHDDRGDVVAAGNLELWHAIAYRQAVQQCAQGRQLARDARVEHVAGLAIGDVGRGTLAEADDHAALLGDVLCAQPRFAPVTPLRAANGRGEARRLDLASHARVGRGLAGRTLSRSVLANLFEALLGAVYLDGGMEAARRFSLETLAGPLAEVREQKQGVNAKQVLQEFCQKVDGEPPRYELLETRGQAHSRAFLVRAEGGGQHFPSAWGRTRKEAEHWAAYEALLVLEPEEQPGEEQR